MISERRMKRAENVLKMFLRKGRKYRKEFRENFEMLVNAQIATEDQIKRTDQQIEALAVSQAKTEQALDRLATSQDKTEQALNRLATSQVKTEQALDRLATSQVKTDEALRRFINSLNKSRNGNSEN